MNKSHFTKRRLTHSIFYITLKIIVVSYHIVQMIKHYLRDLVVPDHNEKDRNGDAPLHVYTTKCLVKSKVDLLLALLCYSTKCDINLRNRLQETALHLACKVRLIILSLSVQSFAPFIVPNSVHSTNVKKKLSR